MQLVAGQVKLGVADNNMSREFGSVAGILKACPVVTVDHRPCIFRAFVCTLTGHGIQSGEGCRPRSPGTGKRTSHLCCQRGRRQEKQWQAAKKKKGKWLHGVSEDAPFRKEA